MANRRELNIGDNKLRHGTKEDIIMKSPSRIPAKGLTDLKNLKHVNVTTYAYYDISKTENKNINFYTEIKDNIFEDYQGFTPEEGNMKMGDKEYFNYRQSIYSNIAIENRINNYPGSDHISGKKDFLTKYEITTNLNNLFKHCINPIFERFGENIALTSVYRNKETNKSLGGVTNSRHTYGYAADIILLDSTFSSTLFNWCVFNIPQYHQLIWEYPERGPYSSVSPSFSWVHISYIEGDNQKINSVSSIDPKIHKAYEDEKTFYLDNFTHKIALANQKILE